MSIQIRLSGLVLIELSWHHAEWHEGSDSISIIILKKGTSLAFALLDVPYFLERVSGGFRAGDEEMNAGGAFY